MREGEAEPAFVRLDGHFKAFCRNVVKFGNPKTAYFFLIDEINRADLARVFGELMYCFEYRGPENRVKTQYQNLPMYHVGGDGIARPLAREADVFADGFYIPENVMILATMNDIDRSVETIDFALRRRFLWREVLWDDTADTILGANSPAKERLKALNAVIFRGKDDPRGEPAPGETLGLNRAYAVGAAYLKDYSEQNAEKIWETSLEPLLLEYARGQDNEKFIEACKDAFLKTDAP